MRYKITLQGKTYEVEVERGEAILLDEYDAVAPAPTEPAAPPAPKESAAPTAAEAPADGTVIQAPLPGSVIDIQVQEGDKVKSGQVLMRIEAMKMENEVLAPVDGVVRKIAVQKGAMVATGDTLLVI